MFKFENNFSPIKHTYVLEAIIIYDANFKQSY